MSDRAHRKKVLARLTALSGVQLTLHELAELADAPVWPLPAPEVYVPPGLVLEPEAEDGAPRGQEAKKKKGPVAKSPEQRDVELHKAYKETGPQESVEAFDAAVGTLTGRTPCAIRNARKKLGLMAKVRLTC